MSKLSFIGIAVAATLLSALVLFNHQGKELQSSVFILHIEDLSNQELLNHYEQWKSQFPQHSQGKILLGDSESAEAYKLENFKVNLQKISNHNKQYLNGDYGFQMTLNQFAHLSSEEFQELHLTEMPLPEQIQKHYQGKEDHRILLQGQNNEGIPIWKSVADLYSGAFKQLFPTEEETTRPNFIDWRDKMNSPLEQGSCGSCYTFASVAAVQAVLGIKENLSTQELIDCDNRNNGCKGGLPQKAFQYISYKGISLEKDYPYAGYSNPSCNVKENKSKIQIGTYYDVQSSPQALETALIYGPVAAAIDARHLQLYGKGIFDVECSVDRSDANHAVLIVGYTPEYFLVRNSWGPIWGEEGYFKVRKEMNGHGTCGIYNDMAYPSK